MRTKPLTVNIALSENSRFIFFVLILLFSCSCGKKENKNIDQRNGLNYPAFEERNNGLGYVLSSRDTLKIIVEFSECGEWGGHIESIFLHKDSEEHVIARLLIDSVSCDNIRSFKNYSDIDDQTRIIIRDTTKQLTYQESKLINLFLHRVFELYLNKEDLSSLNDSVAYLYAGSGNMIHVINTDTTLNLKFINWDEGSNTWYSKIRNQIFNVSS